MFISHTTPVGATTTVTAGTVQAADRMDSISGYIKTDQAGNVLVEQSGDGTNWDVVDTFAVVANTTKTFSVNLIASQVRIRVQNTAGSAQTFCRLYARGTSAGDS